MMSIPNGATSCRKDCESPPDALLPRLAAVTGLRETYVTRQGQEKAHSAASELSHLVDKVIAFVRAGLRDA